MKRIFVVIGSLFLFSFCFAQNTETEHFLSFEAAVKSAIENNYNLKKQAASLYAAQAQYKKAKGYLDFELGAEAQYSLKQNPVDKAKPSYTKYEKDDLYLYNDNIEVHGASGSVYLQKLFGFGLNTKLSYTIQREKTKSNYLSNNADLLNYYEEQSKNDYINKGNLSLDLNMSLLKSFGNSLSAMELESAKYYLDEMNYNLQDSISQVILKTSEVYWNYFLKYKNYIHIQELNKTVEKRNADMDALIKAGVRSKNDLLALQVNMKQTKMQIANAEIALKTSKLQLLEVLGITEAQMPGYPAVEFSVTSIDMQNLPETKDLTEEYIQYIIANRNDIAALQKAVDNAKLQVKMTKIDSLPDLTLGVSVGTTGTNYSDNFGKFTISGFENIKGVNVSGTLGGIIKFGNNTKKGAYEKAEANYSAAYAEYCNARNSLVLQITNATEKMNLYKNMITDTDEILQLQKTLYDNEQKRFSAGLLTVDSLIQQDQNYLEAQLSYLQMLTNYLNSVLEYKYYTGNLLTLE